MRASAQCHRRAATWRVHVNLALGDFTHQTADRGTFHLKATDFADCWKTPGLVQVSSDCPEIGHCDRLNSWSHRQMARTFRESAATVSRTEKPRFDEE